MTQVEMLEQTVEQLSPDELAALRSWFIEIETDSEAGKLDRLAQSAIDDHGTGKGKTIEPPGSADRAVLCT